MPSAHSGTGTGPGDRDENQILPVLYQGARTAAVPFDPHSLTLAESAQAYIILKRRRLTPASEAGYVSCLRELIAYFPQHRVIDFEPPVGTTLIEDFLGERWGHLSPRTYNKAFSIIHNFFEWFVARGVLSRDPMARLERAKARAIHRVTFTEAQVSQILAANMQPREQIALRLLLFFALRKGALRGVRFEHFDEEKRRLIIFTKGETIHSVPIVDPVIWELLAQISEPGHHYLLPKQKSRKRIPPRRKELGRLTAALGDARRALELAADDEACVREIGQLLETLDLADARLALTVEAASTQTRFDLTAPIGEHGMHLIWYRWLARAGIVEQGTTSGRRLHSARHTSLQRVLEKTGNLRAAQKLAGHSTVATTEVYTDWTDQLEQTMCEVLL